MIRIIGDSHCLCFDGAENVTTHWLGAACAFTLWKKNSTIEYILSLNPDDEFWFCFGEIDCRIHIYDKSMRTNVKPFILIENTAYNYMNYLDGFRKQFNIKVMYAPPAGPADNNFEYEFYATRQERQSYTNYFNTQLESFGGLLVTPITRIKTVDLWGYNHRQDLWPYSDYKDDRCHIQNIVAIKRLENYLAR